MGFCPSTEEQLVAVAGTPMGMGGAVNDLSPISDPVKEQLNGNNVVEQRDAYIRAKIDEIRNSIGRDATPGAKATGKDKAAIRGAAKREAKWYEDSERSWRNRWVDVWSEAFRLGTETCIGKSSRWLDITTGMAKRFLDSGAHFDKWATLWAQQKDRSHLDNSLIRARQAMPLKIQAVRQKWTVHTDELLSLARPAAKRLGFTDKDMANALGEYAMARHVPEANAHLLRSWADDLELELKKPFEEQDQRRIIKTMEKIESLQKNIDNVNPEDGVWSCGFTNAQAQAKINDVLKLGVSREEAEAFSNKLVELNRIILEERIANGLVRPEEIAKFPGFEMYVPIHTERWNLEGLPNDARGYNPGRYHKSEGMQAYMDAPDNAFKSTLYYATRAANEIGMKEFATLMAATATAHKSSGRDSGLRISLYKTLENMQKAPDPALRHYARNFEAMGGIVIDAPFKTKDGSVVIEKAIVYFDHKFNDEKLTGLTGTQLNQSLNAAPRVSAAMNKVATATSIYGQMHTRGQPSFAPVTAVRDVIERSFHLASSDMFNTNGQHVSGLGLLPRYFINAGRSTFMLLNAIRGKADGVANTYWNEYTGFGLRQQYTEGMSGQHRTLADMLESSSKDSENPSVVERALNNPQYKELKTKFHNLGRAGKWALRKLDGYNDYFNNIASFNHYVTLREAGLSPQEAAGKVMQSMNLQQSGDYTPVLRMMYPFTKTTLQSSAAMMRSLGFTYDPRGFFHAGKKGWAYMAGATLAFMAMRAVADDSLGEDENGNRRLDSIPLGDLARFFPLGYGDNGDFVKIPQGYGPVQVCAILAYGWDRVERGLMTPEDFASELLFSWVKNTTPGNWPAYDMSLDPMDYLIQAFSPTLLDPVIELATDRTYFGEELSNPNRQPFESAAGSGKLSTPREYHQWAKDILRVTGIDVTPEQVEAFDNALHIGPLRLLQSLRRKVGTWEDDPVYKRGAEPSTRDIMQEGAMPYLNAMGATQLWGTVSNVGRGMFYQAMDYYSKRVKEAGVKMTSSNKEDYGRNDAAGKRAFQENQLAEAGFTPDEIDDILLLYETRGKIGALNRAFAQESKQLWLQAETSDEFREAFSDLANEESELYNNVIDELNYYREVR